jgi:tripartite-type tricarboxylate transporter receptor subunit TctC
MMAHATRRAVALALPGLALAGTARAQAWPERPVTLVVPFAPGAFTDAVGRFVATSLTPRLGQSVVVENRPGAGGAIAARTVARAAPDGYTLMIGTQGTKASNASLMRNPGYDPVNDFTPVHGLAKIVGTLVCNPSRPWRNSWPTRSSGRGGSASAPPATARCSTCWARCSGSRPAWTSRMCPIAAARRR